MPEIYARDMPEAYTRDTHPRYTRDTDLRLREEVREENLVVRAERIVRRGGGEEVRWDQLGALRAEMPRSRRDMSRDMSRGRAEAVT